jgi:hypothetical protein
MTGWEAIRAWTDLASRLRKIAFAGMEDAGSVHFIIVV